MLKYTLEPKVKPIKHIKFTGDNFRECFDFIIDATSFTYYQDIETLSVIQIIPNIKYHTIDIKKNYTLYYENGIYYSTEYFSPASALQKITLYKVDFNDSEFRHNFMSWILNEEISKVTKDGEGVYFETKLYRQPIKIYNNDYIFFDESNIITKLVIEHYEKDYDLSEIK